MSEMNTLLLRTVRVNVTEGHRWYDEREELDGSWAEDRGELYRFGVREYGRCAGKVYADMKEGPPVHVGYMFVKRERYDDSGESYLCETWLSLERVVEPARPTIVAAVKLS
jgi:hypothetical protein